MIRLGFTLAFAGGVAGWALDNGPLLIAAFWVLLLTLWAHEGRVWTRNSRASQQLKDSEVARTAYEYESGFAGQNSRVGAR